MTDTAARGPSRRRRTLLTGAAIAALAAGAIVYELAGGAGGAAATGGTAKAKGKGPAATRAAATRPVKKWTPPTFTARSRERKFMVGVMQNYGLKDKALLKVMSDVPRHEFVPERSSRYAYSDRPLPIGYGQTISQPYIVAYMTDQLKLTKDSRVLEIGTGSGYQAAVLAHITPHVYTIEIIKPLAEAAKKRFARLGYRVIESRQADGYYGWAKKGPFDAIIVTCAAGQVPPPLVKQLKPGGRMIIPVGQAWATQYLMLVEKQKTGTVRSRSLMAVRFVPLRRTDTSAK